MRGGFQEMCANFLSFRSTGLFRSQLNCKSVIWHDFPSIISKLQAQRIMIYRSELFIRNSLDYSNGSAIVASFLLNALSTLFVIQKFWSTPSDICTYRTKPIKNSASSHLYVYLKNRHCAPELNLPQTKSISLLT